MFDPADPRRRLLTAIVSAPLGWQTTDQLASSLGLDRDATSEILADLDSEGWLDPWETAEALYVTLSPRAAEWLRVGLVQVGRSETMRWRSWDEPEFPQQRAPGRSAGRADILDLVPDPAPGPEAEAEATDRAAHLASSPAEPADPRWIARLPRPTILLGLGLTPWPGPRPIPGACCPGCRGNPIAELTYCLVCDRWGLDPLLAAIRKEASPAPGRRRTTPNGPADTANVEAKARAARKARRRRKWAVKVEREKSKGEKPPPPSGGARASRAPSA